MRARKSGAFDLLDPRVQRWIWREGWAALRDVQEEAIPVVVAADRDVVIASATASGKTEAAFLPIASVVASGPDEGLGALYVSPLKALINDQFRRLEELFEGLDLPVHRWHGDVASSRKQKVLRKPSGVLLITPESLEAIFVRRGTWVHGLFHHLRYLVVDELHAFIGTARGKQLQSLMHRVELAARRRIPRIALSATLGDMALASEFLRPGRGEDVHVIQSTGGGQEVRLQVRGYRDSAPSVGLSEGALEGDEEASIGDDGAGGPSGNHAGGSTDSRAVDPPDEPPDELDPITLHLFRTLRGGRHLCFANRRADVEAHSDRLRRLSERARVPNEFRPHHGSLDKALREDAEAALRAATSPVTVLATTTLELGIDVGSVESIAQIGPPPSVASMRQRLGRSGRRGDPAVLRVYVREAAITSKTPPQDQLRSALVQTIAMVRLLIAKWCEPPTSGQLHLSTLVQQLLSLIAQHGGVRPAQAWEAMCGVRGPFSAVTLDVFTQLLRDLAARELITQTHSGELVLDLKGERIVDHYEFYAAFSTPDEYRLVAGDRTLGTLPIVSPIVKGMFLIFAGRRWRVLCVDQERKVIELEAAGAGRAPSFGGAGALVHDRVREEMRRVLAGNAAPPPFLDPMARELLEEARESFRRFGLTEQGLLRWGKDTLLFPWSGDRAMNTLLLELKAAGFKAGSEDVALLVEGASFERVAAHLSRLAERGPSDPMALAASVENLRREKHHVFLSDMPLTADFASAALDAPAAHRVASELVGGGNRPEHLGRE